MVKVLLDRFPDDATVWPGHDYGVRPSSTIGLERATNPFLRCAEPVVIESANKYLGGRVADSSLANTFTLSRNALIILMAGYGFIASVLPVWLLLCPRDYLSSYLKIGTISFLIIGVILVHPNLNMPAITPFVAGGGPGNLQWDAHDNIEENHLRMAAQTDRPVAALRISGSFSV